MNKSFAKTLVLTGLFVGTTDIVYAFVSGYLRTGAFSEKLFHYIAGGALGLDAAMQGGNGVALLGMVFHYFIALSFTFFFFVIFPRLKFLAYNRYLVGMLYGIFVNLTMKLIVLPLSALPAQEFVFSRVFVDWVCFGIVFGIPVVFSAYLFYGSDEASLK